ncbi:MAG: hypothetical protein LIO96_07805 [Lachnospiraceae bacterium]|nr:hypothetical protein [Lachnospiraceae bacterium]
MSYKGSRGIDGYFVYVVPPLEGLWWQQGNDGINYSRKDTLEVISMTRPPEVASHEVYPWAVREASEKKKEDFSKVEFSGIQRGFACSVCISGLMTRNRVRLKR